jgi:hypothetical protein
VAESAQSRLNVESLAFREASITEGTGAYRLQRRALTPPSQTHPG